VLLLPGEPLSNHLDRTMRVHRHSFRDASEQKSLNPAQAVRADDDQVCAPLLCFVDDGSFREASEYYSLVLESRRAYDFFRRQCCVACSGGGFLKETFHYSDIDVARFDRRSEHFGYA